MMSPSCCFLKVTIQNNPIDLKDNFSQNACLTYSSNPRVVFNMVVLDFFYSHFGSLGFAEIHWFMRGAYAVNCQFANFYRSKVKLFAPNH